MRHGEKRMRFARFVILSGLVAASVFGAGGAVAAPKRLCSGGGDISLPGPAMTFSACLAHHFHVPPIAHGHAGAPRLLLFVNTQANYWLSMTLAWRRDGRVAARLRYETAGSPPAQVTLDATAGDAILASLRSYGAMTPHELESLFLSNAIVCGAGNYTSLWTDASGAPAAYWGGNCGDAWVVDVDLLVGGKIVAADPACAGLVVSLYDDGDMGRLELCALLRGNRALAARVYNDQDKLHPRGSGGYITPATDLQPYTVPDVRFSIQGEADARGADGLSRALAALVARRSVLSFGYSKVVALRDGTVVVDGGCSGYSPGHPDEAATFRQIWRSDAAGEPRLVSWRFGRFKPTGY
jgi:hypothetical protein